MSKIVFIGKNGAGKGELFKRYRRKYGDNFEQLAVSGLLDKVKETDPELGAKIADIQKRGDLVPDSIVIPLVGAKFEECDKTGVNLVSDGFPRTIGQVTAMLEAGYKPDCVIEVDADDEVIIKRMSGRRVCSHCKTTFNVVGDAAPKKPGICDFCGHELITRADDNEETVIKRLAGYKKDTYPCIDVFRKAGVTIHTIVSTDDGAQEKFDEILNSYI